MDCSDIDLTKLNKEQLASECKKRNLPTGGTTNEVIKRLTVAIEIAKNQAQEQKEDIKETIQDDEDESDSDDDIGPMPVMQKKEEEKVEETEVKKTISPEDYILEDLPCAEMYEKSYTHPSHVLLSCVTPRTNFLYTASINGSVKIWKKFPTGIEFVKQFFAHKQSITSLVSSFDGLYVASTSEDQTIKIYDVNAFDLCRIITLDYIPGSACWVYNNDMKTHLLAVSNSVTYDINVYDIYEAEIKYTFKYHKAEIVGIVYNTVHDYVISLDKKGVFNYWDPLNGAIPKDRVQFRFQVKTDLIEFKKNAIVPMSLSISASGQWMGVFATNWKLYVFNVTTGKLECCIDESEELYKTQFENQELPLTTFQFNRKLKTELTMREKAMNEGLDSPINCVFDKTDHFVIFGTFIGIKIVNIQTGKTAVTLGAVENTERFINLSLFEGIATISSQLRNNLNKAKKNEDEMMMKSKEELAKDLKQKRFDGSKVDISDSTLFATSFEKRRFYLFTRREPDTSIEPRDVLNEKEVAEDDILKEEGEASLHYYAKRVILHTTMGDIELELWEKIAPLAVENFSHLCKTGYYENVTFHRIIKGFMIQGGDPTGTGCGGDSMWNRPFDDEIVPSVQFDKPFLLAMANAGRGTNKSQFFITTAPAPWLNGKHTIFGKVIKGQSVVRDIERVRVMNDTGKPFDDVKIVSADTYTS